MGWLEAKNAPLQYHANISLTQQGPTWFCVVELVGKANEQLTALTKQKINEREKRQLSYFSSSGY